MGEGILLLPGGWLPGLFGLWLAAYVIARWLHRWGTVLSGSTELAEVLSKGGSR